MSTSVCSADFLSSSAMRKRAKTKKNNGEKEENVKAGHKSISGAQGLVSVWSGLERGFIVVLEAQDYKLMKAASRIEEFYTLKHS